ncbi:hypothetical protein PybrP1_011079 [[Pythium] brassicae (nom. inval.)]|nr:hypothetical protein PybrP1_011079 [[Pythium] brassicae (nom. inval.)]
MMMPLALTPAEERLVEAEADRMLREALAANQAFLANNRELPDGDWKHLRSREDVHVYRTAKSVARSPFSSSPLPPHDQQQGQQTQASRSSSETSSSHSQGDSNSPALEHSSSSSGSGSGRGSCSNCDGSLSKLGGLLRSRATCHACCQEICGKCSVDKKLPIETIGAEVCEVKLRSHTFCLRCLLEAKQAPTREVAGALLELTP